MWRYNEKSTVCNLEEGSSADLNQLASFSWISGIQNCDKEIYIVYKPLSLWYFVTTIQVNWIPAMGGHLYLCTVPFVSHLLVSSWVLECDSHICIFQESANYLEGAWIQILTLLPKWHPPSQDILIQYPAVAVDTNSALWLLWPVKLWCLLEIYLPCSGFGSAFKGTSSKLVFHPMCLFSLWIKCALFLACFVCLFFKQLFFIFCPEFIIASSRRISSAIPSVLTNFSLIMASFLFNIGWCRCFWLT